MRKGSIIDVILGEVSGPGSQNSFLTGVTITDIRPEYLEIDNGGTLSAYPWHSVRQVTVTTI